jgi:hypothetical protein
LSRLHSKPATPDPPSLPLKENDAVAPVKAGGGPPIAVSGGVLSMTSVGGFER